MTVEDSTKRCSGCGETKPLSEFWARKGGKQPKCKDCNRAQNREWRAQNQDKVREYQARDRQKRREAQRAYQSWYCLANSELAKQRARDWKEKNPERRAQSARDHYEANKERYAEHRRNYKARKRGATGEVAGAVISQMVADQGGVCAYCEARLDETTHVDHMLPLVRGGSNEWWNLAVTCARCNTSKRAKTTEEYMEYRRMMARETQPETGEPC